MKRLRELLWSMAEDKSYRKTTLLELEFKIHEDYLEANYKKVIVNTYVNVLLQPNQTNIGIFC
jgi:hypothetical protein